MRKQRKYGGTCRELCQKCGDGDPVVKEALLVAVSRKEGWTRKYSTICACRDKLSQVEELCFVPTQANTYNFNTACHHALPALKKRTNQIVAEKYPNQNNSKTESLEVQGEFLRLLQEEITNIT